MANATAASQYGKFEVVKPKATDPAEPIEPVVPKPSWIARRLHDLRIRIMADTPTSYWNPTMVSAVCTVITLILALTTIIAIGGFYIGIQYEQIRSVQERLSKAEAAAEKAVLLEASKGNQAGHPEQKK